jgi:5-methylcytosine-specific restriction endonuclease McrA
MKKSGSSLSELNSQQVLVLSTGYEPLFKTNWKRAITAVFCGRAEVVETHETLYIGTGTGKIEFPTIVRFLTGVIAGRIKNINRRASPSKKTIWARDKGQCQYCDKKLTIKDCTIDHVIPKSKGGKHTWNNVVIACRKCNQKKGSKLPKECGMIPKEIPDLPPTYVPFVR